MTLEEARRQMLAVGRVGVPASVALANMEASIDRSLRPTRAAITRAAGVPGLFDIRLADGREFLDMTTAQTTRLISELRLVPAA